MKKTAHVDRARAHPPPVETKGTRTSETLHVRLAGPRGFCAGVVRAIKMVEDALSVHGAPVYVRHEIVHNAHVVNRLRAMGAVFVDDIKDVPEDRPLILSAHGAPAAVYSEIGRRGMTSFDATCPLVLKVHNQTRRAVTEGRHVILVGHAGHPEVIGTMGQTPEGSVSLVETVEAAQRVTPPAGKALSYVTQTTLSVDETSEIVATLTKRFPEIRGPRRDDICYATSNRQEAVKQVAPGCDAFLVVGDPTSSNSERLVEAAHKAGARIALLVSDPLGFDLDLVREANIIGISAGASAPETLVEQLLERLACSGRSLTLETIDVVVEDVTFKQPNIAV